MKRTILEYNEKIENIFRKQEFETVKDHLEAFINNFGDVRIERPLPTEGFYVYYPASSTYHIQYCVDVNYLDGWLYGVVQGNNIRCLAKEQGIDPNERLASLEW